jgi:hypothetical protein
VREFLRSTRISNRKVGSSNASILLVKDFHVQFLAASGLTEEAVRNAKPIEYESVSARVFRPEYIIAIAASVGRHKDLARIEQLIAQAKIDKVLLDDILRRYSLKLPKK